MTSSRAQRDVIFLVADRDIEAAVCGLLDRVESLLIRHVGFVVRTHPERDPGCYRKAHDFLRPFQNRYAYALVIFDREGCGNSTQSRQALEAEVEGQLARSGWRGRSGAVVVDPELESWVWSDSPHVEEALGWTRGVPTMRSWLNEEGWLDEGQIKPDRAKETMEAVLRFVRKPRSSAVYRELAEKVSLRRCTDPAFVKFRSTLQQWFPAE